ncbi:hypothetical protein BI49514_02385 [Brevibacterium iodinum ATCC 49514]|uniref:Uncharacterized protein n=1 Tax=Brevibacterium iodinum ATCC 49514 TaxID=1255616 RepID=A0A2H1JUT4_9MICO|nr:hypothetical protein [Brevibacterium iodinum]SMX91295.1 hypothetical protein BI49514_02385 [Brevibacterium iodinum ATCC 49514]SUW70181.1 Uncharacterised protein [Brevibacterium iodinum]
MVESSEAEVRDRLSLRLRLVRQLGERVTQSPQTQLEYKEDLRTLLSGQAQDAQRAAELMVDEAPAEAGVMERYADALVAANDSRTGGQEWAIIQRAARDEMSAEALNKFENDEDIYVTKAASREAALMSWTPTAGAEQVEVALDRYWDAYEKQDEACTYDLGSEGKRYDRASVVSRAWTKAMSGADLSAHLKAETERTSAIMDDRDSPRGQLAGQIMAISRSTGVHQERAWDQCMGRERTRLDTKTSPDMSMMPGQAVTGPATDSTGIDR